jgi:hypothetical protein
MSSSDILSDQWDKRTGSLDSSINFVPYLGPGGGTVSKSVPRAPPLGSPGRDGARRGALKGSASLGYSRFQGAAGGGSPLGVAGAARAPRGDARGRASRKPSSGQVTKRVLLGFPGAAVHSEDLWLSTLRTRSAKFNSGMICADD